MTADVKEIGSMFDGIIFDVDGTADVYDLETDTKLFSGVTKFAVSVEQRNFRLLQVVVKE